MQVICPRCGTTTKVADQDAGGTCPCRDCGNPVFVPMVGQAQSGYRISAAVWLVLFIVGVDTVGVGIGLLLPAVQAAREAKRRGQCVENLKQIGLAMQGYHQKHGCFPPAFIPDKRGKPMHSWRVLILPFLGEDTLYREYRFDEPWNGPNNAALAERRPAVYWCPSEAPSGTSKTNYAMIVAPHAISDGPTPHRISDLKDKGANTMMVAEAAEASLNWLEPRDLNTRKMEFCGNAISEKGQPDALKISSCHASVVNALFCDGSVRTLSRETLSAKELKAMTAIDGGEGVSEKHD